MTALFQLCCLLCLLGFYRGICQQSQMADSNKLDKDDLELPADMVVSSRISKNAGEVDSSKKRRRRRPLSKRRHRRFTPMTSPIPTTSEIWQEKEINETEEHLEETRRIIQWRLARRYYTITMIKKKILSSLKMNGPPDNTVTKEMFRQTFPDAIPEFLRDNNFVPLNDATQTAFNMADLSTEISRIIVFSDKPPIEDLDIWTDVVYFRLGQDIIKSHLLQAELYVFIEPTVWDVNRDNPNGVFYINIHRIVGTNDGGYVPVQTPDKRKKIPLSRRGLAGWQKIYMKHVVEKWQQNNGSDVFGLRITCSPSVDQSFVIVKPNRSEEQNHKPYLMVKIIDKKFTQSDRNVPEPKPEDKICTEDSSEAGCCGYPLRIDFDKFGWDWIIQPRMYKTRYCAGVCYPRSLRSQHSPHLMLLPHFFELMKSESGPCCTPVKRSPLSMIFFDGANRLVAKVVQDLVIDSCGCN